jgi:hypothetical protein
MKTRLSYVMILRKGVALILFLPVACGPGTTGVGGGGGGTASDTLQIVEDLTGVVNTLGSAPVGGTVFAGDQDESTPGLQTRGVLSFDLTTIPVGKTIRTAYLKVIQSAVEGAPLTDLGNLVLDHVDLGGVIDAADFSLPALSSGFAVLSDDPVNGRRLVNVFQRVKADLAAGRTVSQFRVRFSVKDGDNDGFQDLVKLNDVTDDPPPIIILTYNE